MLGLRDEVPQGEKEMTPQQKRCLKLVSTYTRGTTGAKLDRDHGWPSAHKRLTELADMGMVTCIGTERTFGSRTASRVWIVSKKGLKEL